MGKKGGLELTDFPPSLLFLPSPPVSVDLCTPVSSHCTFTRPRSSWSPFSPTPSPPCPSSRSISPPSSPQLPSSSPWSTSPVACRRRSQARIETTPRRLKSHGTRTLLVSPGTISLALGEDRDGAHTSTPPASLLVFQRSSTLSSSAHLSGRSRRILLWSKISSGATRGRLDKFSPSRVGE